MRSARVTGHAAGLRVALAWRTPVRRASSASVRDEGEDAAPRTGLGAVGADDEKLVSPTKGGVPIDAAADASARSFKSFTQGYVGHRNAAYHQRPPAARRRTAKGSARRSRSASTTLAVPGEERTGAENEEGWEADLPMVHPGAQLPPLTRPVSVQGKFSFLPDIAARATTRDYFGPHDVPNNTPKPLLPMWASSLTSPALGKQRLVEENWISADSLGLVAESDVEQFRAWLGGVAAACDGAARLPEQLAANVELHPRAAFRRGVYAKRHFSEGDVVLRVPLATVRGDARGDFRPEARAAPQAANGWATTLNAETLRRHSDAVRERDIPSYETVRAVLDSTRSSQFDPIPSAVFVDLVHFSMMLACERAAGESSAIFPYLQLMGDVPLDDEHIRELHRGVLDPHTHMEYSDHRNRFTHYLRELHRAWWAQFERSSAGAGQALEEEGRHAEAGAARLRATTAAGASQPSRRTTASEPSPALPLAATRGARAPGDVATAVDSPVEVGVEPTARKPPPSLDDLEWAFRVALSRQRVLPGLRHGPRGAGAAARLGGAASRGETTTRQKQLDWFARGVMRAKLFFYQRVLRVVDEAHLRVDDDADESSIATIVPLVDMFGHPPGGRANCTFKIEHTTTAETMGKEEGPDGSSADASVPHLVIRTTESVDALDELTLLLPQCYSVAYTLYRFGFLPLRQREENMTAMMKLNGVDGELRPVSRTLTGSNPPTDRKG